MIDKRRYSVCSILCAGLIALIVMPCVAFGESIPEISFEPDRSKIIIPTSVNGSKPLRLILDTGMGFDGVYLFHKDDLDLIDTTGAIEVKVPGAGGGEPSTATMIETGKIKFGEVTVADQRIIVSHSAHTQSFPTDGVIGWNLFGHYVVEIDYDRQVIHLRDTSYVHDGSGWYVIPVDMMNNLPYFDMELEVVSGEIVPVKMYIDLASSEALELLVHPDQKYSMPDSLEEDNLGTGLSGDINGFYGRCVRAKIGEYNLRNVRAGFAPAEVRSKKKGADGILGNDFIRRFNIIFDYPHSRLLIKPNNTFDVPFD